MSRARTPRIEEGLIPIRLTRVTSNDGTPILYLTKEVRELTGLELGDRVLLLVDPATRRLVVQKLESYS